MTQIGITEQGDAAVYASWKKWVYDKQLPAILITKDPRELIRSNQELFCGNLKGNVILHATITGMGGTVFEPGVKNWAVQLDFLEEVLNKSYFHKERLVIRLDPIIPTFAILNDVYLENIINISKFAVKNNLRFRTSFFDYYPHVRERFSKLALENPPQMAELILNLNKAQPELHLPLDSRIAFLEVLKEYTGLTDEMIEICGEPGMKCTGCVSQKDLDIFGIKLDEDPITGKQRPACACLGLKKELLDNKHPCMHNCMYCYWKN